MLLAVPPPFALSHHCRAFVGSFLPLVAEVNRRTITGASRNQLIKPANWSFTGWLKGVIEGVDGYTCSSCVALYTPDDRSICPYRRLCIFILH